MTTCNVKYDKKSYLKLAIDLKLLYYQINRPGIEDVIIKTLEFKYKSKDGEDRKLLLTDFENLDEASRGFIDDVNNIICGLTNSSLDNLPDKAIKFRKIVLSTFFDMNNVGEVTTQISEDKKEMATDEDKEARKLQKIEDALLEIYGPINTGLILEITNSFGRELRLKLIYNNYLKIKYELSAEEINRRIVEYKLDKFESILNFLKEEFPLDKFLQSITTMYSNNMLNSSQYYYVIDTFKKYILLDKNRNEKFNKLLEDKILQTHKILQESSYKKLIEFIMNTPSLKTWFNNKYNTNYINLEAKTQLFMANRFSNYYLEIKDKLLKEINRGANFKDEVLLIIHDIENPENDLLNYVNDYITLTLFDDLLSLKLGDSIGIERGFLNNIEPQRQTAKKYKLRESHKHQNASWEYANSSGSELHTSANVKDMLNTIFIYKYNETHLLLPQTLDMTSLMLAWQSLITDILNNDINFDISNNKDVITVLKDLINTQNVNVVDNIIKILEILFKPLAIQNSRGRMIDFMRNENLLSEQHKNILYSFYNEVLNINNANSNIAIESANINNEIKYSTKFFETVSDLCAVMYRNVNNNYIDCNLQYSKAAFLIKKKFNWDSNLFDSVERITFKSKMKQINKLGEERLFKYHYVSTVDKTGRFISKVELKGKGDTLYTFGFKYILGNSNIEGLFSSMNNLNLENTMVTIDNKLIPILDILADINIRDFSNKVLTNKELLNEYETVFSNLLEMFDYYLDTNFLSDKGLEVLLRYKEKYKYDPKNKLYSKNYLNHFLKLAIRAADIDDQIRLAGDLSLKEYLTTNSKYLSLFTREAKKPASSIFDILVNKVYFKPVTTNDEALSNLAKNDVEISGKAARSTSLNKAGASVANYSISRLGSELNKRLYEQLKQGGPASSLLFVRNMDALDIDPVIDSEITTSIGDVKAVKEMSSSELFYHALLDKFYNSYLHTNKICFLPTVYSDKTTFLNYMSNLSMFSEDVMNLMNDTTLEFIDLYRNTFFSAHNQILANVVIKMEKLMNFLDTPAGQKLKLKKDTDIFKSNRLNNVRTFLRNRTESELSKLVYYYNEYNAEKIELEKDKDYRFKKTFCDLNEITDFYTKLYNDPNKLKNFLKQQLQVLLENLLEYRINFLLFNSSEDLNLWTSDRLKDKDASYIVRLLSNPKILKSNDRKKFADMWINKDTGELILEKNGELNPFLLKFFYIEGIFSNNLRLSLSGTEINHPDKAFDTLFNRIKSAVNDVKNAEGAALNIANETLKSLLNNNNVKFTSLEDFISEFSKIKTVNDLDGNVNMLSIYDKSIIEIINTALGTQFKRNVIIPATLQHPLSGLINGPANKVKTAVIYDMKAPVNNLRESDSIDSLDGSAVMSSIQVLLENKALGDLRVGINRKPIWDDLTEDLTSFLAKFAAFGQSNSMMILSLESNSSLYNMFKKMHNIRWNGTIDLTKNINLFEQTMYDQEEVSKWFKEAILQRESLFYKNQFGEIVNIIDFGKDDSGYFTVEKIFGKNANKVYHYYNENSEHFTEYLEGLHNIDSLYELFIALGGINCTDAKGVISEFNHSVLTNFVINVGHKVNVEVNSINDVVQPLKDKFIGYVFNNSAVKNGAKNINNADAWMDDTPLNTFYVNLKGLGIQLNADHDVVDSELTEFSQVVAACAAYGKDYKAINEIYYSLAESAFLASEQELNNILKYFNNYTTDPSKAKYLLYKIVGKLIVQSKSNSDMDLTEKLKLEINKEFQINKDNTLEGLKIPFSDPSIYTQFITSITSVINLKSIKRKHPGSGYVMAPGYNVVLYFQIFDSKTKTYKKYFFLDILKRARNDFRGKLINALEDWCIKNNIDPNKYGDRKRKIYILDLRTLIQETKDKIDPETIPYMNIVSQDVTSYNRQLVNIFLESKLKLEQTRDKSWFMPTDIVNIIKNDGTVIHHDLSDMKDFYKFKNGLFDIEDEYDVTITEKSNKYVITLKEDKNASFVIEKESNSDKWNIHFKTGGRDSNTERRTPWKEATEELKIRLFNAALQTLPNGAILRLSPTTKEQLATKIGGLTKGSIFGYLSIILNDSRHSGVNLEVVSQPYTVSYFDINGNVLTTLVSEYKKISNIPNNHSYKLNITKAVNLKPSLIRWKYIDPTDGVTKYMTIYDHPIIRNTWNLQKSERPKQAEILAVLDLLDLGKFELNGQTIDIIPGSLENTEAEIVLGNMYQDIFLTGEASLADIIDQGENFFKKLTEIPKIPAGFYNLAFVKNNGQHTLISFSNLVETMNIYEDPFDYTLEYINEDNEIYTHKDGIKIGKYVDSSWEYVNRKVLDLNGNEIDKSKYKLIQDSNGNVEKVLKRVDYIKRYKYAKTELVNGEQQLVNYTLYNIAPVLIIREALSKKNKDLEVLNSDAHHLISTILKDIYSQDKYIDILVNTGIKLNKDLLRIISNNLVSFGNDTKYDTESGKRVLMTPKEIKKLPRFLQHIIELRNALLEDNFIESYDTIKTKYYLYLLHYKKLYASFLTSLHFISSRIPAQSLQSFMPMICVGWTANTSNTAYVSYILTYLLGSDY